MGITYNTKTVRDGLVLHLDAANVKSYPGSGTAWNDLSGNGNNGALINGVGYSGNNNGSLSFDGVNDYVTIGSISLNSANITAISWVYLNSFYSPNSTIGIHVDSGNSNGGFRVYASAGVTGVWMRYSSGGATTIQTNTNILPLNKWIQLAFVSDNQSGKIYVNDAVILSDTFGQVPVNVNGPAWISRYSGGGYYLVGNTSSSLLYNRALTESEIRRNFNALRGRYGI